MIKRLICTLWLTISIHLALQPLKANELPKLGDVAGATLSVQKEQMIGDQIMTQIRRSQHLVRDPLINDYIQQLGHRLVAVNPDAIGRQFKFFVVQSNTINAFALPGGYIGIHTELIAQANSESELASVLGHEVAHVTQRHLARRIEQQSKLSLPSILGVIASVLIATQDAEAGIAGITATQAAGQQSIINHTRENEKEADRIGIGLLSAAGFDTRGAAQFFEVMQDKSKYSFKPPEILLTHPLSRNRIAEARDREKLFPEVEHKSSLDFTLVKARVKSLAKSNDSEYFSYLQSNIIDKQSNNVSERFQFAEMAKYRGNNKQSISVLNKLYKQHPNNMVVLFSLAEAHLANESSELALPLLLKQLKQNPGSTKLILATANAYLQLKQAKSAQTLLLRYAELNKSNYNYLFVLAKTQQELGRLPEMHETTGQYYQLLGDFRTAKQHYELALSQLSTDPYAQTRIQARLSETRKQMRALLQNKLKFG